MQMKNKGISITNVIKYLAFSLSIVFFIYAVFILEENKKEFWIAIIGGLGMDMLGIAMIIRQKESTNNI